VHVLMLYPRFPAETFWNSSRAARQLMNASAMVPPLGLLTIASYLPDDFEIRLIDRNINDETAADWQWADVVFLSLMLAQEEDYATCLTQARQHGKPVAVGGPYTHAKPDSVVAEADWVCFGEGETIMETFIADLRAGRRGRQYDGGNTTNMEQARVPRFDLLPRLREYDSMAIQFSRGCPFRCEFCDIIEIYGRVPRTKTPAHVLRELEALKALGYRGFVFLVDDNFIGNKRNAKALLAELAVWNRANGYTFKFYTEASLNLADDEALLTAMTEARMLQVFIGIETPDRTLLKQTLKMQNIPGDPIAKLQVIRSHGLHIMAGFIVGFDDEDPGIFETQQLFVQASGVGIAMMGLLQALPHTQLSRRLQKEGRLLSAVNDHGVTTVSGINFIPKGTMTKREYLERYAQLITDLYSPRSFFGRIRPALLSLRHTLPLRAFFNDMGRDGVVLLRLFYYLGIRPRDGKREFWRTFLEVLWKNPLALESFGWDCYHFLYLREHVDYVQRELSTYLSSSPTGDVLDEVIRPLDTPAAATAAV
jgi:radical SAM superfamily enzyme YgiQ (UPF0313 family)